MNVSNNPVGSGAANWSDLNAARVKSLSPGDDPRLGFAIVWPNILWVAEQFWRAQSAEDDARRVETWHHLVMAVGNFKRQGGTQICLLQVPKGHVLPAQADRPMSCKVQTLKGEIELTRDDPNSWKLLTCDKEYIRGLQVATATTLLSALWPGKHIIIDIRDLKATVALNLAEAVNLGWVTPESKSDLQVSWDLYTWVRTKILEKTGELNAGGSGVEAVQVERALYTLSRKVDPRERSKGRSWSEYAAAVGGTLMEMDSAGGTG